MLARTLRVVPVPCLTDNYAYLLIDVASGEAAAVDAVEPAKIAQAIKDNNVNLTHVLTTHHHQDHAGGNEEMATTFSVPIFGGDARIPAMTRKLVHGDNFKIGAIAVTALETPCHTSGHICFYCTNEKVPEENAVFTGDTLFIGGCGRFFEGSAEQMVKALHYTLGSLPDNTNVYCGHEYTRSNLKFAQHIEPQNQHILDKLKSITNKQMTVPSTIGEEKLINPFMRCGLSDLQQSIGQNTTVSAMDHLRKLKNEF